MTPEKNMIPALRHTQQFLEERRQSAAMCQKTSDANASADVWVCALVCTHNLQVRKCGVMVRRLGRIPDHAKSNAVGVVDA